MIIADIGSALNGVSRPGQYAHRHISAGVLIGVLMHRRAYSSPLFTLEGGRALEQPASMVRSLHPHLLAS